MPIKLPSGSSQQSSSYIIPVITTGTHTVQASDSNKIILTEGYTVVLTNQVVGFTLAVRNISSSEICTIEYNSNPIATLEFYNATVTCIRTQNSWIISGSAGSRGLSQYLDVDTLNLPSAALSPTKNLYLLDSSTSGQTLTLATSGITVGKYVELYNISADPITIESASSASLGTLAVGERNKLLFNTDWINLK